MATVVITFTDSPHGTIQIAGEVDPPLKGGDDRTPAQELGFRLLQELYAIEEAGRIQRAIFGNGDPSGTKN
jgi:hypothetical protein